MARRRKWNISVIINQARPPPAFFYPFLSQSLYYLLLNLFSLQYVAEKVFAGKSMKVALNRRYTLQLAKTLFVLDFKLLVCWIMADYFNETSKERVPAPRPRRITMIFSDCWLTEPSKWKYRFPIACKLTGSRS